MILYTNARSILSKIDHLNILINDENPHLVLLTESWCNDEITNAMINIEGYEVVPELRVDRLDTVNGIEGGLLVYKRLDITVKPESDESSFNQYCKFQLIPENSKPLSIPF